MPRLARLPLAAALTLALGCQADHAVTPPFGPPAFALSDGAHDGNPDFFFLPPLLPDPSADPDFEPGDFNAHLRPTVEVCELETLGDGSVACVAGDPVRRFEASEVRVVPADEHYIVNWHTDESNLDVAKAYRIRVLVGTELLGFADVDPVSSGKELKSVATGEYIGLVDGRTLPIKFRIENGSLCTNDADCAEQVVTDAGGQVVTNTGFAAAAFRNDWLREPFTEATVVIERVNPDPKNPCHPTDLQQFEGCYHYRTIPDVGRFNDTVRVEVCLAVDPEDPLFESLQLFSSDADQAPTALPSVPDLLITCEGFAGGGEAPIGAGPFRDLRRFATRAWDGFLGGLTSLLAPRPAHATLVNLGLGGETESFSNIGWARPATLRIVEGDGGGAVVGATITARVRVVNLHETEHPVAGTDVTFAVDQGGGHVAGELDIVTIPTDLEGYASVPWTLGPEGGANTLRVSTPFVDNSPRTLTVTGHVPVTLIDCGVGTGGDLIGQGFYVARFPGTRLDRVTLYLSARTAGTYTFSLTARSGTYDGSVLGVATATVALSADDQANVATAFTFRSPAVTQGSTVTFTLAQTEGPAGAEVFYAVPGSLPTGDPGCPVSQTEGTTPPLDTFRRQGVHVRIEGGAAVIP
ncbi:MAG TPA: hypothetical protein VNI61_05105 [Gemmatimonadales bacterium]|nr:hypothetical protein [Gemmatimonadales bacterium]